VSVNAINGNMSVRIPAAHLPPGPGGLSAGVDLVYNSTIFDLQTQIPADNTSVLQVAYIPSTHGGGWQYGYKYTLWSQTRISLFTQATCGAVSQAEADNWYKTILATPDGANHALRLVGGLDSNGNPYTGPALSTDTDESYDIPDFAGYNNANCNYPSSPYSGTLIYVTADSTYIRVEANTVAKQWTAYFPDGTQISGPIIVTAGHAVDSDASLIIDRNSNAVSIAGNCVIGTTCTETLTEGRCGSGTSCAPIAADGLGRFITIGYTSKSASWQDTITYPGPNATATSGAVTTYVNWAAPTPYPLAYYCRVSSSGATYAGSGGTCNLNLSPSTVSSVQLPTVSSTGNSTFFIASYTNDSNGLTQGLTAGPSYWGELHSLSFATGSDCTNSTPTSCQTQWNEQYTYLFDSLSSSSLPSSTRPPGTATNPIASKTMNYAEAPLGNGTQSTPLQETTKYYSTVPANIYSFPTVSSTLGSTEVLYPDGSYQETLTANICPSNLVSRDLCLAVPYKTVNRDGSVTEMQWVSNALAPGVPSGADFNPYVQYRVDIPPATGAPVRIRYAQQDLYGNGNTTTVKEYDWAAASSAKTDPNSGIITSVCASGCALLRETDSTFNGTTPYWSHGSAAYLRAPQTVTVSTGSSTWATSTYTYDDACGCTTANVLYLDQSDNATNNTAGTIRTSWTYLSNGNVASMKDPNSNLTQFTYACGPNGDLYPASATVAGTLHTSYSYNCTSGFLNSVTDSDNLITTSYTYDELGRTTQTEQKNTSAMLDRSTCVTFDDKNQVVTTKADDASSTGCSGTGSGQLVNKTYFDALG
jgi:hypothetical protein